MTSAIQSVLHQVQVDVGGEFMEDAGWTWFTTFGDPVKEYEAIRSGASVWDVYALQKWDVRGAGAQQAIQRTFANNLGTLAVGQVKYGPFVDESGLMTDDGTVYKHADDHFWVMTNGTNYDETFAAANPGSDVTVVNRTLEMPVLSVQGPGSRELVQGLTDYDVSSLRYFRFATEKVTVAGIEVWLLRTGFSGELGFELIPAAGDAVALWRALTAAGAVPIGLDAVELARVEAGLIIVGVDYAPGETSPLDLSLDKTIALGDDVDYVGKAALVAAAAAPANRFKTLRIAGGTVPEYGAEVLLDGTAVGVLTSPIDSPRFGVIGLAILRSDLAENGQLVDVVVGDGTASATVDDLSIHDPEKKKARS